MADRPVLLPQGVFAGHARAGLAALPPDPELTQVGPGTPCGEYLRRFWQPVALAAQLGPAPVRLRRLGEDLVLFRDQSGNLGLLHLHCCHRNASLEHGIIERQGLRCAYHGWQFDIDGTILDMPAEPADSPLRHRLSQGAYPVLEHKGVVFAYLGPIADMPDFPVFDTMDRPAERLAPMLVEAPVNWLQVFEAAADPLHLAFHAARRDGAPFHADAAAMPVVQHHERASGNGVFHSAAWRVGEQVRLVVQDHILPNFAQDGAGAAAQGASLHFRRTARTQWVVPVDDAATVTIGWWHAPPAAEAHAPWLGQGTVNVQGREQLGAGDAGVVQFRRRLRRAVRALAEGEAPLQPTALVTTPIPTYAGDTVLTVPMRGAEDRSFMAGLGHRVADIYRASDGETGETREAAIRRGLRVLEAGLS